MRCIAAFLLLASVAFAQQWEVERVDSAGWGYAVRMKRHPDGRAFLCHRDLTTGQVRLAWNDGSWHHEDVPQPSRHNRSLPWLEFGPRGEVCVTYYGQQDAWLSSKDSSGWSHLAIPDVQPGDIWLAPLAYDSADQPVIAVNFDPFGGEWVFALGLLRLQDSVWVLTDTIDMFSHSPRFLVAGFGRRADRSLWGAYETSVWDVGYMYMAVGWFEWRNGWQLGNWYGTDWMMLAPASGDIARDGSVHACFYGADTARSGVFYDRDIISGERPEEVALRLDTLDRPHIAYAVDSALKFCYRDGRGWHFFDVGVTDAWSFDVMPDTDGSPLIAYANDDGLFLARGIDVTGAEERPAPPGAHIAPGPTIVRNVLFLPTSPLSTRSSLFDMTGRAVISLSPGANDVGHLQPGVYVTSAAGTGDRWSVPVRFIIVGE